MPGALIGSECNFVSFMKICLSINLLYDGHPKIMINATNKPATIKGWILIKNFTNHMIEVVVCTTKLQNLFGYSIENE